MEILDTVKSLMSDDSGATAIEYGLIAALVSVAAITALTEMGSSLRLIFNHVAQTLNSANVASSGS
jgi:pilus assembly protein Flp/PilA